MTSPEPSSALLTESVDGFLSTLCLNVWIVVVCIDGLLACFCHKLTHNLTGGYDHSVLDTFVQLTEGRSARDQPKQPPAKKKGLLSSFSSTKKRFYQVLFNPHAEETMHTTAFCL